MAQSITLSSPNGGETYYVGNSYSINWESTDIPASGYIRLEYSVDSGQVWKLIETGAANSGSYSWDVPDDVSAQCLIRASDFNNSTTYDISDSLFQIKSPFITVTYPNGGEELQACSEQTIRWELGGIDRYVNVDYSYDGGNTWTNIGRDYIANNTNYYNWTVPSFVTGEFKIRVRGYYDESVWDESDSHFSVTPGSNQIEVVSPNGGESWSASSYQTIFWDTTGVVGNVSLRYSTDGGANWDWVRDINNDIANNVANTGHFKWLLPHNESSTNCLVRVYEYGKNCLLDHSDHVFTIDQNPAITIRTPNGGEKWYSGRSFYIRWFASNLPSNYVDIDYSADNGNTWSSVATSVYGNGSRSYNWDIPDTVSSNVLIRVSATENSAVSDISDDLLSIDGQSINILAPNGGEALTGCEDFQINYDQEGVQSRVRMYYSLHGDKWIEIGTDYLDGYTWDVPTLNTDSVKLKVSAYYDASVYDTSDAVFSVSPGENYLTITSPNGGESFGAGSFKEITWNSTGTVGNVSLKYSTDNGSSWDWVRNKDGDIANNLDNAGSFNWLVPENAISTNCLLQIYDYRNSCRVDYSDSSFVVDNSPAITITEPSGGEKWYRGRNYYIRWASSNLPTNYVRIDYSSDSGATWKEITASTYSSATDSYRWTIPADTTSNGLVKISAVDDSTVYDVIKTSFSIAEPSIKLTAPIGGDSLTGCSDFTITWEKEGLENYVDIDYSLNNGDSWIDIGRDYNSNNYVWEVPSLNSENVKIRVRSDNDHSVSYVIDSAFSIYSENNLISVTYPNGVDTLGTSTLQDITWDTTGTVGDVSIKYSTNGGEDWDWVRDINGDIANRINNDGSFQWLVPENIASSNCIIQIYDYSNDCIIGYSDSAFTILNKPAILITSGNGGETWYRGRNYYIRWSSSNLPTNYVRIEYSSDSGDTWNEISSSTYYSSSYRWTIPADTTSNALIKVSSVEDSSIYDISNSVLTLKEPTITLLSPLGGESLPGCGETTVSWESEGLESYIDVDYSLDGGSTWLDIGRDYIGSNNTGSYEWSVPSMSGDNFKVRVRGNNDNTVFDTSSSISISPGASYLTINQPNGGESWPSSSIQEIKWTTTGVVEKVSIKYSDDGGSSWNWVEDQEGSRANNISNSGSFTWLVPSGTVASNCLIQIYDYDKECVTDYSDNVFEINNNPTISVTSPTEDEILYFDQREYIRWSASNLSENYVNIDLSVDSGSTWASIITKTYNDGSYRYTYPDSLTEEAFIRVSSYADSGVYNTTKGAFKILTPQITVSNPNNGDENWKVGENKNITWSTSGLPSNKNVRIEYSGDGGATYDTIVAATENSGSFIWTIADIESSADAFVKVSAVDYPLSRDSNDVAFTIVKPVVGVTVPNDGQTWYIGQNKAIEWTSEGLSEYVSIEFSSDSGDTWQNIATSTANTGFYYWEIPGSVSPSDNCFIKVSDANDLSNTDSSDVAFSIAKPSVSLTNPSGSEKWYLGESKEISWENTGVSSAKIKIEYSADSGSSWSLVKLVENTGSYQWAIPSSVVPSSNAYIKISNENDPTITDSNSVVFEMVKPSIEITNPDGGEIFYLGQTKVITWEKEGAFSPNVRIDYSADSGNTWNVISASAINDESYNWTLPASLEPGSNYILRIRDAVDPTIVDYSSSVFEVSKPTITVTYPDGGETLYSRESKNIKWQSAALSSSRMVKIEVSDDNGSTWTTIAAETGNDGTYSWIPTGMSSGDEYRVKVTDVLDPTIFDISNAEFTVTTPVITVTSPDGEEKWYQGQTKNIRWTSSGLPGAAEVSVNVSSDSGSTWSTITSSTENDGRYEWDIPTGQPVGSTYLVTIADKLDPLVADSSDKAFSIYKPTLSVSTPDGDEVYFIGTSENIYWNSQGLASSRKVKIEISSDSGSTWTTVVEETNNDGRYNWTLLPETEPGNYFLKVSNVLDPSISAISDSQFKISKPTITVLSPDGGERWYHDQGKTIKWSSKAISSSDSVKIEYSSDNGSSWSLVTGFATNSGSFDWIVPSAVTSEEVIVKVTSLSDATVNDQSNSKFSIYEPRAGDSFETAIPVASLPATLKDTTDFYSSKFSGAGNQPSPDVFYFFTVPQYTDSVSFGINANYRALIHVLSGKDAVVFSSDYGYNFKTGTSNLEVGKTYYLVVEGNDANSGRFRVSVNYHVPAPDLAVESLTANQSLIGPGDTVNVNWDVVNAGRIPAVSSWTERIYMQSAAGENKTLIKRTSYESSDSLGIAQQVARSAKVEIPKQLNVGDQGVFVVELRPGDGVDEVAEGAGNNTVVQQDAWTVKKLIIAELSSTEITEGESGNISVRVSRTGSLSESLDVNVNLDSAEHFDFPSLVTIPEGDAGYTFLLSAPDNDAIEGVIQDALTLSSTGFETVKKGISLIDNDKPSLTISGLPEEVMEGDTIRFTIETNLASKEPLEVYLTSKNPSRFSVPASVTVPAQAYSKEVMVILEDDDLPEVDVNVNVVAGASNHHSTNAGITVKDDDLPNLELVLETGLVSETGGPFATRATLRRTAESNQVAFKANLSADLANTLVLPASVSLAKGEPEKSFNVGVVDNNMVDGEREVTITASAFVSSCGCNAPATSSGSVSVNLQISDNDGPALQLTANELTLKEGLDSAGYIRVARNTATDSELAVQLSSSDANEATVSATVIIPEGKLAVNVPVKTINDGVTDGNKQVYFQATANGFATGSVWAMVSDQNKPDLQIAQVNLNNDTIQAMSLLNYRITLKNSGFSTAPTGVLVRGYLSEDNSIDESDTLISEDVLDVSIPAGETVDVQNAVRVPNIPGDYKLLYRVNPDLVLTELWINNNNSTPVSLRINPEYTATARVSAPYYSKGSPVSITGTAINSDGTAAVNKEVEVFVITRGLRRTVMATTDDAGNYNASFTPLANESGYYTVGASFPGMEATEEQDDFNILGVRVNNGRTPEFKVIVNDTLQGSLSVKNTSNKSLTDFTLSAVDLPDGARILFDTVSVLAGNSTANLNYQISGSALSSGNNYKSVKLQAVSEEGIIQKTSLYYYCQAPRGYVVADVSRLDVSASQSKGERLVELQLVNNGRGETGDVTVSLPQLNWLRSVTPKTLSSMGAGDTSIVVLKFLALEEVPFNYPVRGSIGINTENGNSLNIPFVFEKVSESTGTLEVEVTNQFTYYSEDEPKVAGAYVKVRNYFSGEVYAEGYTDSSGVYIASDVPEGKHKISVEKVKHKPYNKTVTVNPGDTTKANVFINYQAITFNWTVEPTAIEDEYDITLETEFETHVPMPVVTIEMPEVMPELSGTETYAFNVTLTNHGLITANEVELGLPDSDPEYEFITSYEPSNLIAQQSIQVPVVMKRRTNPDVVTRRTSASTESVSDFLDIENEPASILSGGGGCRDFVSVVYWYTCNISTGLWEKGGTVFEYEGRTCSGGGDGGGDFDFEFTSGDGGGSGPGRCATCTEEETIGTGSTPEYQTQKKSCVECLNDLFGAAAGCASGGLAEAASVGACLNSARMNKGGLRDILNCIPLPLPPPIGCLKGIHDALKTCSQTSAGGPMRLPASVLGSSPLGEEWQQIERNYEMISNFYQYQEDWSREYYGSLIDSDSWKDLKPELTPFVNNLDSIPSVKQSEILSKMEGYEITQAEIQSFFTRWNTSINALNEGVMEPGGEYPDIINWTAIQAYSDSLVAVNDKAVDMEYESIFDMHSKSRQFLNEKMESQDQAVCASVKVQFSQKLTMTREAFEGTLEIFNGHPTDAMDSITVHIEITDENGVPANGLFEIQTKDLSNLSDVTGTGVIASEETGVSKFLFIPEPGAAPQTPKKYSFGGNVTYWDPYAGSMVTMPLASVELTVNPSPNLMLHYFMERNILGDDPLTDPEIEPIVPAELAVMVENHGYGPAVNMTISSAQPQIVENEKGLAIDFNLIGSNFQGEPKKLGVTDINFGTVPARETRIGQWYFTSTLLGKFVSYEAEVVHANSFGNPDLSLVKGIELHELTQSIKVYGEQEDGINDFLVNDNFDSEQAPDIIYLSQGRRTEKVYQTEEGSFSAPVSAPSFVNTLTVTAADSGWNYIKLNDPGSGNYEIERIVRGDGQEIPLNNAWLTFVTLPVSQTPVYEDKFHFVDRFESQDPVSYTVTWKPKNTDVPEIVSIDGAPEQATSEQVQILTVTFNKSIDPATFTQDDLSLTFQGGSDIMDNSVTITQTDSATFDIDVSGFTTGNGFYNLTVQAANIKDIYGISGKDGRQATWSQFINVPTVQAFEGLPEGNIAAAYDTVHVRFNLSVDELTISPDRFIILKDSVVQEGALTIDSVREDSKMVYLSGLSDILTENGTYDLVVDLPNIKSAEGVSGIRKQSVSLTVDNTGPQIVSLEKSGDGGLDSQHITFVDITFDENVSGFNIASVDLERDGESLPLNIAQLSNTDLSNWRAGNFGMLTYHEGNYNFTVALDGVEDKIGNIGQDTMEISWTVDRSSVITVSDIRISPDHGVSASDGITHGQSIDVMFDLSADASLVTVSQVDLSGETVLAEVSNVSAGETSVPVTLLTGGNTGIKVNATSVSGAEGSAVKSLFIDQVPLSADWLLNNNSKMSSQIDTVRISLSSELLNGDELLSAVELKRNGLNLSVVDLNYQIIGDTLCKIYGIRDVSSGAGKYEMSVDLQLLNKSSSGINGSETVSTTWTVESENQTPVAKAGTDTTITSPGVVTLDGSASFDPDSDQITYEWIAPEGVDLDDAHLARPSLTISAADQDSAYSFLLIVSDGTDFSTDVVDVTVNLEGVYTFYYDGDKDGFGVTDDSVRANSAPGGYVANGGDCNDDDREIHPEALDVSDGIDNNCNGEIDEGVISNTALDNNKSAGFNVIAYPVPSKNHFNLQFKGLSNSKVDLKVYDGLGNLVEEISNVSVDETVTLGEGYKNGLYIIEAIQGKQREVVKVTKL